MIVLVPNYVSNAIYKKVDVELAKVPKLKDQRENIFTELLEHFNRTGEIPDFHIKPKEN